MKKYPLTIRYLSPLFFISTITILVICAILYGMSNCYFNYKQQTTGEIQNGGVYEESVRVIQIFCAMILSNICSTSAYLIYTVGDNLFGEYNFWHQCSGYILLIVIGLSVIANNLLDSKFNQNYLDQNNTSDIRLLSSITVMGMFALLMKKSAIAGADKLFTGYTALVLGRFLYFDFTKQQFIDSIKAIFKYSYLAILLLIYFGILIHYMFELYIMDNIQPTFICTIAGGAMLFGVHMLHRFIH